MSEQNQKDNNKKVFKNQKQIDIVEDITSKDQDVLVQESKYNNIKLKDIFVGEADEEVENKKFSSSEQFHDFMRRGLTILQDENQRTKEVLRKGHKKFDKLPYDKFEKWIKQLISYESQVELSKKKKQDNKKNNKQNNNTQEEQKQDKGQQIEDDEKPIYFSLYKSICIYRTTKEDGSNSQISYCKQTDSWVICTKNVSVLIKDQSEIQYFQGDKIYIKEIAKIWFEYLQNTPQDQVEEIKCFLSDRTLLGELIGSISKQYVEYGEKSQVLFFSIVENSSDDICIPPSEVEKIFNKFKLNHIIYHKSKDCETYQQICQLYLNIQQEVTEASFLEKGEGEVLYICGRTHENPEVEKVITMVKVKTEEYNNIIIKGTKLQQLIQGYDKQVQLLLDQLIELKYNKHYLISTIQLMIKDKIEINKHNIIQIMTDNMGKQLLSSLKI